MERSSQLKKEGKDEEALAALQEALQLAPTDTRLRGMEVQALSGLERHEEALEKVNSLLAERGEIPLALKMRGDIHLAMGSLGAAEADYRRGLRLQPGDRDLSFALASLLLGIDLGSQEGVDLLAGILALNPDDQEAQELRASLNSGADGK